MGAIIAIAGVITGFVPVSEYGKSCGGLFSRVVDLGPGFGGILAGVGCDKAIERRAVIVWVLIILGIILLLWGLRKRAPKPPAAPTSKFNATPPVSKSAQMDDLIALKDAGTLTEGQFQAGKDRILGKTTVEDDQKAKLDALHASGVLTDADYLAAVEALNK